jgi:hypothetical protein
MIETLYFAAPVAIRDDGNLTCDLSVAVKCDSAEAAEALAEHMARSQGYVAAWAFSHGYDPTTGNLAPAEVVKRCGDLHWCPRRRGRIA